MKKVIGLLVLAVLVLVGCSSNEEQEAIDIYTSRDYEVDAVIYENFTATTGIEVNVVEYDNDELVTKVIAEKDAPVADVIIVNGAQFIYELDQAGVLQPINQDAIDQNMNEDFYGDKYVGLTARARGIAYNHDNIDGSEITTYADLADPKYQGEILVRSSESGYNVALIENMIQTYGAETTQEWATGIVNNMAQTPDGGDRDQIKGIYNGDGNIAILNSYYYHQMLNSSDAEEVKAAESVTMMYPEDVHINMTWLGVTSKGAENSSVDSLISYLTSAEVQQMYYDENYEYALNSEVEMEGVPTSYQPVDFETLGQNKDAALAIFEEAGWE